MTFPFEERETASFTRGSQTRHYSNSSEEHGLSKEIFSFPLGTAAALLGDRVKSRHVGEFAVALGLRFIRSERKVSQTPTRTPDP